MCYDKNTGKELSDIELGGVKKWKDMHLLCR